MSTPHRKFWWHRLTHLGVTPTLPPQDAKYFILGNTMALVMTAFSLVIVPLALRDVIASGHLEPLWLQLALTPFFLASLWFTSRSRLDLATIWFGLIASVLLIGETKLLGRRSGMHFFLLLYAVGPFALVPRTLHKLMWAQIATYLAMFIAVLVLIPVRPLLDVPSAALDVMALTNVIGVFLGLTAFGYYERTNTLKAEREVEAERQRAEELLLNILPSEIAERLKHDQSAIADGFASVTVLFADIAGFTPLAKDLPPADLVAMLNRIFSAFDTLVEKHGLEKIKTIGDAYMVAAGLPRERPDHATQMAHLALDMLEMVAQMPPVNGHKLAMRIGIHSGPVVAGVIGKRKFIYDLWGDTVNTAARMESHGEPGAIQLTEATFARLDGQFVLEERGIVEIKGKGPMPTWWLRGRKVPSPEWT